MKARGYQSDAINAVFRYFEQKTGNPLVVMPTGTGKSIVIAVLVQTILLAWPRQRILILTHVKELIEQNAEKLATVWPGAPFGIFSAGLKQRDYSLPVIFGGVASVYGNEHLFGWRDLLIIDEAHLLSNDGDTMYRQVITRLQAINPKLKVIGLSATPYRLGQGHLTEEGGLFTDVAIDMTTVDAFNWFIAEGYLLPLVPRPTSTRVDVSKVGKSGGDFAQKALEDVTEAITEAALAEAMFYGQDRQSWLVFAAGVENAEHAARILNDWGIPAAAVHSKLKAAENDQRIADFKAGKLRALVNYGKLTTGFDHPPIDLIVMLRATISAALWVQMLGRGTRPVYAAGFDLETASGRLAAIMASSKHNCLVLDFAGNSERLGPINDPKLPRKKGESAGEMPVKICPACGIYNHAAARWCGGKPFDHPQFNVFEGCGAEFEFKLPYTAKASTVALVKESEAPITEWFDVKFTVYRKHEKPNAPPSVRVIYHAAFQQFSEWVAIEHPQGKKMARDWWRRRHDGEPPETADELLRRQAELRQPKRVKVWVNRQPFPEVLNYEF